MFATPMIFHLYHVSTYQQEGFIALWRGWLPSVIGVIPYVGLNFAVYETLKEVVLRYHGMCVLVMWYQGGSWERSCNHVVTALRAG